MADVLPADLVVVYQVKTDSDFNTCALYQGILKGKYHCTIDLLFSCLD
jgi:hypothetical protein